MIYHRFKNKILFLSPQESECIWLTRQVFFPTSIVSLRKHKHSPLIIVVKKYNELKKRWIITLNVTFVVINIIQLAKIP